MTKSALLSAKELLALLEKEGINQRMGELKSRWLDERQYENFSDYIKVGKALFKAPFALVSMTKGFKCVVRNGEQTFEVTFGVAKISISQLSGPKSGVTTDDKNADAEFIKWAKGHLASSIVFIVGHNLKAAKSRDAAMRGGAKTIINDLPEAKALETMRRFYKG
jgi:hypothetical protein